MTTRTRSSRRGEFRLYRNSPSDREAIAPREGLKWKSLGGEAPQGAETPKVGMEGPVLGHARLKIPARLIRVAILESNQCPRKQNSPRRKSREGYANKRKRKAERRISMKLKFSGRNNWLMPIISSLKNPAKPDSSEEVSKRLTSSSLH